MADADSKEVPNKDAGSYEETKTELKENLNLHSAIEVEN